MEIRELYMENFGKFHGVRIKLDSGINILQGENEFGKSTIYHFIRGMLFGIEKQRGRGAGKDTYTLYEPWSNPAYYKGMMRFESDGKIFRLERNFEKNHKSAILICETDGEQLSVEQGDLKMLLGDLTLSAFDNSVSSGQLKARTDGKIAEDVQAYMTNYEESMSVEVDILKALTGLKKKKKQYQQELERILHHKESRQSEILGQKRYIEKEIQSKKEEGQELLERVKEREEEIRKLNNSNRYPDLQNKIEPEPVFISSDKKLSFHGILGFLTAFVTVFLFLFFNNKFLRVSTIIIGGCLAFYFFWKWKTDDIISSKKEIHQKPAVQGAKAQDSVVEKKKMLEEKIKRKKEELLQLQWRRRQLLDDVAEQRITIGNLEEDLEKAQRVSEEQWFMTQKIEGIDLAISRIKELSSQMVKETGGSLKEEASKILEKLTKGKYRKLQLDEKMNVTVEVAQDQGNGSPFYESLSTKQMPLEFLSHGTIDQIFFAVRMAVSYLFCKEESMPLIFDESFVLYDEERLKQVLAWLFHTKDQVLIFTCHKREIELLKELQLPFKEVYLE